MSSIRELRFDEIAQVSGGGNAGDHDCSNSGDPPVVPLRGLVE